MGLIDNFIKEARYIKQSYLQKMENLKSEYDSRGQLSKIGIDPVRETLNYIACMVAKKRVYIKIRGKRVSMVSIFPITFYSWELPHIYMTLECIPMGHNYYYNEMIGQSMIINGIIFVLEGYKTSGNIDFLNFRYIGYRK